MLAKKRFCLRWLAALVVLASMLLAPPGPVWACSCVPPQGPDAALIQAEAVFSGTVTAIVDRGGFNLLNRIRFFFGQPPTYVFGASRLVTLSVVDSWKGVMATPVTIATGSGSADCGFGFNVGGQYLVYAYSSEVGLATNMCWRTAELAQAPTDVAYLQTQPTLAVTQAASALPLAYLAGAICLLTLLAVGTGAAWVWRRQSAATARAALPGNFGG